MRNIRYLFSFLIYCLSFFPVSATQDPFMSECDDLQSKGTKESLVLVNFLDSYRQECSDLLEESKADLAAEKKLTERMDRFVNLLLFNFNTSGIDFVKSVAPLSLQLRLASSYFDRESAFNLNNRPVNAATLNHAILGLYLNVWQKTKELVTTCMGEIGENIASHKKLSEFVLPQLSCSQREDVKKNLMPKVNVLCLMKNQAERLPNVKLSSLTVDELEAIEIAFIYIISPFSLLSDLRNFAWCLKNIKKDDELCETIYTYAADYKSFLNHADKRGDKLPPLIEWIGELNLNQ